MGDEDGRAYEKHVKVDIDGLEVLFPYERVYDEQIAYMKGLKKSLDSGGQCVLEMPSGTGKTISLLALVLSYKASFPSQLSKIIYCSRTLPEIDKVVEELRRLISFRAHLLPSSDSSSSFLGLALSSRRNLCIHPTVSSFSSGATVDAHCRNLTSSWVRSSVLSSSSSSSSMCE